ncbi:hypothetical protein [Nocardiopsis potens]|uniref:hypothetical protein n=1 Tax=Nocardiopsis potens TaxID=1246458 RepID=UPI00034CD60A|nr:hypothetical protein [Nocardiopsis potens]
MRWVRRAEAGGSDQDGTPGEEDGGTGEEGGQGEEDDPSGGGEDGSEEEAETSPADWDGVYDPEPAGDLEDAGPIAQHSGQAKELGFEDNDELADYLQGAMAPRKSNNPANNILKKPKLKNGRIAWHDENNGVIVIRNTQNPTKSTAYKGALDEFLRLS